MFQLRLAGKVVLRLLLAGLAIVVAVQAFRLLALPAAVALLDLGEASTSIVRRLGIFVCAIAAYWAYCRGIEKRTVDELRPAPLGIARCPAYAVTASAIAWSRQRLNVWKFAVEICVPVSAASSVTAWQRSP